MGCGCKNHRKFMSEKIGEEVGLEGLADKEDVGAHLSYWMTKFIVKTQGDEKFYASEVRKIFDKYAETREDGTSIVPNEKVSDFQDDVAKLGETEAEDPGIRFKLAELADNLKLSMKQMFPLLDFIEEE